MREDVRPQVHVALPEGTTMRIAFTGCRCNESLYLDANVLAPLMEQEIRAVDLTPVSRAGHNFDGAGCTLCLVLAESHVAVHTWPELDNTVLIDLSVCDYLRSNRHRVKALTERFEKLFQPRAVVNEECDMRPRLSDNLDYTDGVHISLSSVCHSQQTEFQNLLVADTPRYGRALVLDGTVQTTEADGRWYHEPLVHVPMLAHPKPRHVLVCGGGDGGAVREILRHPSVETCTLVEIDEAVIAAARNYLPTVHDGALDHARVAIRCMDAKYFLEETKERYDVAILDLTDPVGPAENLFGKPFYSLVKSRLAKGGFVAAQVGPISDFPEWMPRTTASLREVFPSAEVYHHHVPAYGVVMGFALCSTRTKLLPSRRVIGGRLDTRGFADELQILSPETYHAMFALPPVYDRFVREGVRPRWSD